MINVMSFSSGVRTRRVFGWVSVICFTSAVSVTVSQGLELQSTPQNYVARCGENVTLKCEATSSQSMDVFLLSWLYSSNTLCRYKNEQSDQELLCKSAAKTHPAHYSLTLTLLNIMPVRQGQYLCKLQTNQGGKASRSIVTVQDCLGTYDSFINKSHATCWFSGVYPKGIIHWFHDHVNLTEPAITTEEMDQHGRYNVSSTINTVQKGNLSVPYMCSLWTPSSDTVISQNLYNVQTNTRHVSSGHVVKLHSIFVLVEIMVVKWIV